VDDVIVGRVRAGGGRAARLVKSAELEDVFGYVPFPGTLNLQVDPADKERLKAKKRVKGPKLGRFAGYLQCEVLGFPAHVHFAGGRAGIEILAPLRLRDYVSENDMVEVRF
jgi:CTP-dependent riboflavin kinase